MDSSDLSREQYDALAVHLRPMMRETAELHTRAERHLEPGDPLLELLRTAADRASALWVFCHYRSAGVGGQTTRHG